jgi:hypothetical protein
MTTSASFRSIQIEQWLSLWTASHLRHRWLLPFCVFSLAFCVCLPRPVSAFAYLYANEQRGGDVITHPGAYSGSGGTLTITVAIDPDSPHIDEMLVPVRNAVAVWNRLLATTVNVGPMQDSNLHDFESMVLHEMGHALGLTHPNNISIGGFARAFRGPDGNLSLSPGFDGFPGTGDDLRGDDVNINWFQIDVNNPFQIADKVDGTTYSQDLADLPVWDNYAAIGSPQAAEAFNVRNTTTVTYSVNPPGVHRRALTHDDVAGIRFAMAGLDERYDTADDYTILLEYVGVKPDADITLSFNGFDQINVNVAANTNTSGNLFEADDGNTHSRIHSASITFDGQKPWFFNNDLVSGLSYWQNGRNRYDATNDGFVSSRDALVIINQLYPERGGARQLAGRPGPGEFFYDVSGDGRLSSLDALRVINYLARRDEARAMEEAAEGEQVIAPVPTRAGRARQALVLDGEYGFYAPLHLVDANYYADHSWNPDGVKFILSSRRAWYYLTPAGELHELYGWFDTSPLVAILDPDYYDHPELLFNATESAIAESVSN